MKTFLSYVDKLDVEKALKSAAILIFLFKMVEIVLTLAGPFSKFGWGLFASPWLLGIFSGFVLQMSQALFQPLVLLALARVIAMKKRAASEGK